ncbi:aldose 1-epimerase-like protein [Leishmania major strain Friedlin]|uniref:glucose-6-phosphate 1-epimerase n=1 Tax=Leishmania major TaxID=5664 RepID=Q4Q2K6_LEIMA|nr:aldose 1-epimerase-like protein [Leishmania major strain Friedlin]CAG9582215.1 aldose_1-epimerase-like_protein [Leishmania major strain Friedlin]CAJ08059.1 aldose 1-epimerase-like protein [Leishmania major strain Friedlin]|eukprot:XP_001686442.1 aldose 1-epimerase-like protein [Leishmania major strain Friedlin]
MVTFTPDSRGRNCVTIHSEDGSSITVYEQGAHVSSWKTKDGKEHLYLSPTAIFADRTALRGGVPLIFPQFGAYGPLQPSHGFARIRSWNMEDAQSGRASFSLRVPLCELLPKDSSLTDSPQNAVNLLYTICFSNTELKLRMKVTNTSEEQSAPFQFAFHTYFAVSDVSRTVVSGVNRSPFVDNCKARGNPDAPPSPPEQLWIIRGEHDRVYPDQACAIVLQDMGAKTTLQISSPNLSDVCLWNPGESKCAAMKDMPPDGYKHFVCVEHGKMLKKVVVPPCSSWTGTQEIAIIAESPHESSI